MPIAILCTNPACAKKMTAKDELAGKTVKCPGCATPLRIPGKPAAVKAGVAVGAGRPAGPVAAIKPKAPAPKPVRKESAPDTAEADGTPVEEIWRASPLLRQGDFQAKQKLINWWALTQYLSEPNSQKETGVVKHKRGPILFAMEKARLDFLISKWCEVTDAAGTTLFWLRRRWHYFSLFMRVDIFDPTRKQRIGYFKIKFFSLHGGLWVFDANDQQIGEVKPNFGLTGMKEKGTLPAYHLVDNDDRQLGFITADHHFKYVKAGQAPKVFGTVTVGKHGYAAALAPDFAGDVRLKVLLLSATLIMDVNRIGWKMFDPMAK